MRSRIAAALSLMILLGGCAARTGELPANAVRIGPSTAIVMPAPADLDRSIEAAQLATARYGDQTFVFETRISVTPDMFRLVSVDTLGRRTMSIAWTGGGVYYEAASWVPEQLRPENVLADIVLLYWPEETVRHALVGGTLQVAPGRRTVVADGKDIIRAEFHPARAGDPWTGTLHYENVAWGYVLDIQSQEGGQ
ncbi:MAG: DUF3261 domain-containing protein [Gemmatimonas sp.]